MIDGVLPKPNDGFEWAQAAAGPALVCRRLAPHAQHFVTTRQWRLGTAEAHQRADAWADVARAAGVEPARLVRLHQVHGAAVMVHRVGDRPAAPPDTLPDADIVVTNDRSLALTVQTADCVPLLIADSRTGAVAAAHAGWRGLAAGVPRVTVQALADVFDSRPENLVASIGPSISAPHYEVDGVVHQAFAASGWSDVELTRWFLDGVRTAHWQFDGWAAARDQLEAAGVRAEQIAVAGLCTASHPATLCSYRRDGTAAGRLAAVIRVATG